MVNTDFYSSINNNLGALQTDQASSYMVSLPVVERSLVLFANTFDISNSVAEVHNIRKLDQLKLDVHSRTPLSRDRLNDDRIVGVSGGIVPIKTYAYGISLIIDSKYKVNTSENIISNCVKLLSDWQSRLKETLLFEMLRSAGATPYVFSKGDTSGGLSGSQPNIPDAISMKQILDKNRVRRTMMRMIRATDQIGTHPVGQTFISHISIDGRGAWEQNLSGDQTNEIVRPFENPSTSDYIYQNLFYIKRADLSIYHSTEISDSPNARIAITHGDEAYIQTRNTPFTSSIIMDPEYRSAYGMHSKVSLRVVQAEAVLRDERIVNGHFTDN